jgi:RecJ-like exonuclease
MSITVLDCPRCGREWQITGDGNVVCESCGYKTGSYAAAIEYLRKHAGLEIHDHINIKSQLPVYECPRCGGLALTDQFKAGTGPGNQFLCFSCGSRWAEGELERCPECIQWRPGEEFEELIICRSAVGFYVCRSCYEKIFK